MYDLNCLMHAAVDDARPGPDVGRLLAVSVREGTRIRRRRTLGYAGAGLAVAAVVSVSVVTLGMRTGTTVDVAAASSSPASPAPIGSESRAAALQAGESLTLGHGVIGTVVSCTKGKPDRIGRNPACVLPAEYVEVGGSTVLGTGTGFAVVLTGPSPALQNYWSQGFRSASLDGYGGLTFAVAADSPLLKTTYQGQAVTIHLPGWKQVGIVADDKQSLTGPGGAVADIVWRPAGDHASWTNGQKNDPLTWTSPVHDGIFVTIQGGRHTTGADIQALGASLTWN